MKKPLFATLTLMMAFATLANPAASKNTASQAANADKEWVQELKLYCEELAEDEGIEQARRKAFVLDCVNQELKADGYPPLPAL